MSGRGFYANGIDVSHDASIAIGAGKVPGVNPLRIQGYRVNLTTVSTAPALVEPTLATVYPSDSGEAVTVKSDNVADVGVLVRVLGLDSSFKRQTGFATLSGTTSVPVTSLEGAAQTWSRINELRSINTSFVGAVSLEGPSGLLSYMLAIDQRSQIARLSIAADEFAQVLNLVGSVLKDGGGTPKAITTTFARTPGGPYYRDFGFALTSGVAAATDAAIPGKADGPLDIEYRAYATAAGIDVFVRSSGLTEEFKK